MLGHDNLHHVPVLICDLLLLITCLCLKQHQLQHTIPIFFTDDTLNFIHRLQLLGTSKYLACMTWKTELVFAVCATMVKNSCQSLFSISTGRRSTFTAMFVTLASRFSKLNPHCHLTLMYPAKLHEKDLPWLWFEVKFFTTAGEINFNCSTVLLPESMQHIAVLVRSF